MNLENPAAVCKIIVHFCKCKIYFCVPQFIIITRYFYLIDRGFLQTLSRMMIFAINI